MVAVLIFLTFFLLMRASAQAEDPALVPSPFRGDTPDSDLSIRYDDLTMVLKQTVLDAGRSDRSRGGKARAAAASHIVRSNRSHYSLEGNRVMFTAFEDDAHLAFLTKIRNSLEAVPDTLPLRLLSRDEQLAYWLNLYNVTVLEQIAALYPEERLQRHYQGNGSLWDRKLLSVAGVALSLNDIHHKILIPKFDDPLVMYGLFQGFAGGPNIRRAAYDGKRVKHQLQDNAEEFINSNRGVHRRDRLLKVSHLYDVNAALFPNFEQDLKAHLLRFVSDGYRERIASSSRITTSITNYAIADIHNGYKGRGSAVSTNPAALLGAIRSSGNGTTAEGHFGPSTYISNDGGAMTATLMPRMQTLSQYGGRFPNHVVQYLKKIDARRRASEQDGEVTVEEMDDDRGENAPR